MRRYLLASLLTGLILALCGPIVVHFILPQPTRHELMRALSEALHKPLSEDGSSFGFREIATAFAIRMGCGFVAMLLVVVLARKRSPWRAARQTAFWMWLFGYLAAPLLLYIVYALQWQVLLLAIVYGFLETNIACHAGTWVWTRGRAKKQVRP